MRIVVALLGCLYIQESVAQDRSPTGEAKWMLERITGVKWAPDASQIVDMAARISAGDKVGAAKIATSQPQFYSVTVKEMSAKMSSRAESVREPLNDFSASFIGIVRDNTDARELLYGNFYYAYTGTPALPAGVTVRMVDTAANQNTNMLLSNNHFVDLENANLNVHEYLTKVQGQRIPTSTTANIASPEADVAGVLTQRAFLSAHAVAGTNRRLVEFTFREFMCQPIEGWADTSASDIRVGKDIDRVPGGDPNKFLTTCKGCHSVMDGFRGAFARWDFNANVNGVLHSLNGVTTGGFQPVNSDATRQVMRKLNRDTPPAATMFVMFPGGWNTVDTSFVNNADRGVNATTFGWRGLAPDGAALSTSSSGTNSFGRLIANSKRFSQCMAKRIWDQVCKYSLPEVDSDIVFVGLAMQFEQNGYKMKDLFETVASHPKCRL